MEYLKTKYQIEVINRIRLLRQKNKVSQTQLANILYISNGYLGNIESIKYPHKYTLKQLYTIAKYFGVPIAAILIENPSNTETINEIIEKIIEYDE